MAPKGFWTLQMKSESAEAGSCIKDEVMTCSFRAYFRQEIPFEHRVMTGLRPTPLTAILQISATEMERQNEAKKQEKDGGEKQQSKNAKRK